MSGYTQVGPFVNGSAPGIAAAFLNGLESDLLQLQGSINAVVVNGGTSGTATCYQILQGTYKYAVIVYNNFKTAGSTQNLVLPVAFTYGFFLRSSQTPTLSFLSSAAAQSCNIRTSFPASASASGGVSTGTSIGGYNDGECRHPCDTVQFAASGSVAANGYTIMEGV